MTVLVMTGATYDLREGATNAILSHFGYGGRADLVRTLLPEVRIRLPLVPTDEARAAGRLYLDAHGVRWEVRNA